MRRTRPRATERRFPGLRRTVSPGAFHRDGGGTFCADDHASPGVVWLQTSVTATQAVLDVTAQIANGTKKVQSMTLVTRLLDARGTEVTNVTKNISLQPSFTEPFRLRVELANPHLWNGRPDPYLYRAVMELRSGDEVVDAVDQPLGLRSYFVDPENGFF